MSQEESCTPSEIREIAENNLEKLLKRICKTLSYGASRTKFKILNKIIFFYDQTQAL